MAGSDRISFRPETWTTGGMIDDADVEVMEAEFVLFDYNGQQPEGPAFRLALKDLTQEDTTPVQQYWSAGSKDNFVPTDDGKGLTPTGKATGLSKSSNLAALFDSLLKKGFPVDRIDNITDHIIGGRFHMNKIALPKVRSRDGSESKDRSALVVTTVIKWPWDKVKSGAGAKTASTTKPASVKPASTPSPTQSITPAAAESNRSSVEEKASESLLAVVRANGGTMKRADVSTPIFKLCAKDPEKSKIVKMAFDAAFLSGPHSGGKWVYDVDSEEISLLE